MDLEIKTGGARLRKLSNRLARAASAVHSNTVEEVHKYARGIRFHTADMILFSHFFHLCYLALWSFQMWQIGVFIKHHPLLRC